MITTSNKKMTSNGRRGTYVLTEIPKPVKVPMTMSGLDRQNIMRLKINRIALVQEIKVEHIVRYLSAVQILTEHDRMRIESGTTPQDKARILIDIIPLKTSINGWYKHFRDSLLNTDAATDQRKRYRGLVEFLDNTVIHRPSSQGGRFSANDSIKLPHYDTLPDINEKRSTKSASHILDEDRHEKHSDEEEEKGCRDNIPENVKFDDHPPGRPSMTLVKGFFHQWIQTPDNFRSLLELPRDHFLALRDSSSPDDKAQLEDEEKALKRMKKLEVIAVLNRRKQLPEGFEICMCEAFHEVMYDRDLHHLYMKYFKMLQDSDINLINDICSSWDSMLMSEGIAKSNEALKHIDKLGFHLVDFLSDFGYKEEAVYALKNLMAFINTNPCMETWVTEFKSHVKLMSLRNDFYDFNLVHHSYSNAIQMTWQIDMVSFGKKILDQSMLYMELSRCLLEQGSFSPAFGYANKALQEVTPENHHSVIDVLCNAVMTYCGRWQVRKAEELALQAVGLAKEHFGKRHPQYVKAMLHLCHCSSEFQQDNTSLKLAQTTLETAKIVYGCDNMQLALAHRAVAKALLILKIFTNEEFYYHASEAMRIAKSLLCEGHPQLSQFHYTLATALQWRALHASKEAMESTLEQAENQAKQALYLVMKTFGDISFRTGQVYMLLGQIYAKMDRKEEAESMMLKSVGHMELCLTPNNHYLLLAYASLGMFSAMIQKISQAVEYLKKVINNIDQGVYLKWVHICYDMLIDILESFENGEEANAMQIKLSEWMMDNPILESKLSEECIEMKPKIYAEFMRDFLVWKKAVNKVQETTKAMVTTGAIVTK